MTKTELITKYVEFVKKNRRYPKRDEFNQFSGATRDIVRNRVGDYTALKKESLLTGDLDNYILDVSELNDEYNSKIVKNLKKYKRFVITTAVANSPVDIKFYKSIKTYCKHEDAALIVLPSIFRGNDEKWNIDPVFRNDNVVTFDYSLNSNISVLSLINNSKSVDPISGLPRLSKTYGSFVCASPKQNMKVVPTGIEKLPHIMMSTGAITKSSYRSGSFMQTKQNLLADNDHILGAVIVELDKDEVFHLRQIQADKSGGFADLGTYYSGVGKKQYSPEVLVSGDIHVGESDPTVMKIKYSLISKLKVQKVILHDVFDGVSLNPHESNKLILLTKKAYDDKLNLEKELKLNSNFLKEISSLTKEVIVVASNHDEFLNRYLEAGDYVKHPYNHKTALRLALDMVDSKNPFEEEMRRQGVINKVRFLKRDESYKIANIELGQHGDKGQNGAKASLKGLEESYGPCIVGHGHSPKIERSAWMVGTSTVMDLGYNVGASSWLNSDALVYPNGNRQMIVYINGKYTTKN